MFHRKGSFHFLEEVSCRNEYKWKVPLKQEAGLSYRKRKIARNNEPRKSETRRERSKKWRFICRNLNGKKRKSNKWLRKCPINWRAKNWRWEMMKRERLEARAETEIDERMGKRRPSWRGDDAKTRTKESCRIDGHELITNKLQEKYCIGERAR